MVQVPTVSVNVRFETEAIRAIDEYAAHLRRVRNTGVSRSDVLRYALLQLPIPQGAEPELIAAFDAIGAKGRRG